MVFWRRDKEEKPERGLSAKQQLQAAVTTVKTLSYQIYEDIKSFLGRVWRLVVLLLFLYGAYQIWQGWFFLDLFISMPIAWAIIRHFMKARYFYVMTIDLENKMLRFYGIPDTYSIDVRNYLLEMIDQHGTPIYIARSIEIDDVNKTVILHGYYDTSVNELLILVSLKAYNELLRRYQWSIREIVKYRALFTANVIDFNKEALEKLIETSLMESLREIPKINIVGPEGKEPRLIRGEGNGEENEPV